MKKMFKKLMAVALAGVMAVSMLAGCAGGIKSADVKKNVLDALNGGLTTGATKLVEDPGTAAKAQAVANLFKANAANNDVDTTLVYTGNDYNIAFADLTSAAKKVVTSNGSEAADKEAYQIRKVMVLDNTSAITSSQVSTTLGVIGAELSNNQKKFGIGVNPVSVKVNDKTVQKVVVVILTKV
ncbi:MAG: hypothetical protein ACI4JC_10945 [Faecalibacterium sp.]